MEPKQPLRRARKAVARSLVLAAVLSAGCADAAARAASAEEAALDAVGAAVVDAFVSGDTARLRALKVSPEAYRDVVHPRVREARPGAAFPPDVALLTFIARNDRAMYRYAARLRGLGLEAVETRCPGPRETYREMEILTGCRVTVRAPTGRREELSLFDQVVRLDGTLRVLRYDD